MIDRISLKILRPSDVTPRYVSWLSDPLVTRYSDNQYRHVSLSSQKEYVQFCIENPSIMLWGIYFEHLHIGNVALDNLNFRHSRAEVTYLIGDPNFWGKGIASYAVRFVIGYADKVLGLYKLIAGVAEPNVASIRVLTKCGFIQESRRESHLFYNNSRLAQIDFKLILR